MKDKIPANLAGEAMSSDSEKKRRWLEAAIRAPSADNLQPWKFLLSESSGDASPIPKLDLFIDEARVHAFCDQGLLTPYLSCGAVIENLRVAAALDGFETNVQYLPQQENPYHAASIGFREAATSGHPHARAVLDRSTNRKLYDKNYRIEPAVLERFQSIVTAFGTSADSRQLFRMHWIEKQDPRYARLAEVIAQADRLRFEIRRLHKELFSIMRFSASEVEKQSDGLDIKTLESGTPGEWMFRLIRSWSRLRFLNRIGMSRILGDYARKQMLSSSGALLLTALSREAADFIRGGELTERIWHECTRQGLALQPMEGLPVFTLNMRLNELGDLTDHQKGRVKRLTDEFYEAAGLGAEEEVLMLFRAGRAKPPSAVSVRRPVESFIQRQNEKITHP